MMGALSVPARGELRRHRRPLVFLVFQAGPAMAVLVAALPDQLVARTQPVAALRSE